MRRSLAAALLPFGVVGCATAFAPDSAPITERAEWKIGDEWRYAGDTGKWHVRIVEQNGDLMTVERSPRADCPGCRDVRDKNWALVRILDKDGNPFQNCEVCGARAVDFPMSVGKTWQHGLRARGMGGGAYSDYINHYRVQAFENVKTKAGTFKAYRINVIQENVGPIRWLGRVDLWWSPEVRAFVKRRVYTPDWERDYELESYTLK
jgi:hypothetical protein